MEVVVTTGTVRRAKLQSNHHHQQTNTQFFLQARCPSCHPTNSVKALKGKYHIPWTCLPQAQWGLPTLSLTISSSWLPWGRVALPHISPLMTVSQHWCNYNILIYPERIRTWALLRWCSTKRRYIKCTFLYLYRYLLNYPAERSSIGADVGFELPGQSSNWL